MSKFHFLKFFVVLLVLNSCTSPSYEPIVYQNPLIDLDIPIDFPPINSAASQNMPTKYGVELGKKLFFDTRLSKDNTVSCASCHQQKFAYSDNLPQAKGVKGRIGLRNTPSIQNLLFSTHYNWDGSKQSLITQAIVPIITPEEMDSSILQVIDKIKNDPSYQNLFKKAFKDAQITPQNIYKSLAQYQYSLISANSLYDKVINKQAEFTPLQAKGQEVFTHKCSMCHTPGLFTDQSFRNIGFPINPNTNEAGRARVTGELKDYMSFKVPTLRNIVLTAPYGSFGQFETLEQLLDYLSNGVLPMENLDPILKQNGNRIALSEQEKQALIEFMSTLTDLDFINQTH
ncbi:cytochrome-c peroxidase [Myroides sp. LJL119]